MQWLNHPVVERTMSYRQLIRKAQWSRENNDSMMQFLDFLDESILCITMIPIRHWKN